MKLKPGMTVLAKATYDLTGRPTTATESESELLHGWRFTTNHFILATSPLRLTTGNFICQLNTCGYSLYETSSLTRGRICRLQLLLVFARAVIFRPESRGTHDISLSHIREPPTWKDRSPYLYHPGTGCPGYTLRQLQQLTGPVYNISTRGAYKTPFLFFSAIAAVET
jgi:hypothetical protein